MSMSRCAWLALVAFVVAPAGPAAAQTLGTFSWQLQPFCNVVTVRVTQTGAVYTLDGYDDQCGALQRAPLVGTATPNPDGSIGLGLQIVTVPGGRAVSVDARISLSVLGGPWTDSAGNSGTLVFGVAVGGSPRPAPASAPTWGTVIPAPASPTTPGLVVQNPDTVSALPAPAISAQVGGPSGVPGTRSAAIIGESAGRPGVLGVSGSSTGVLGTSGAGAGVTGLAYSPTSPGVYAASAAVGGMALQLEGAVKVSGPARAAFQHTAAADNTFGINTYLDHPLLNGDPTALVFVTHVYQTAPANVADGVGVFYDSTDARWAIFRLGLSGTMPVGARFNVLVIKQ